MRFAASALSLCFVVLLVCVGGAEFAFRKGNEEKDVALLRLAQRLNPLVSEYFYAEYRLMGDIGALRHAMLLEPTRPAYPMYYGLALIKQEPRTRAGDWAAMIEICKASRLKPYSKQYRNICAQFKAAIPTP